MTIYIILAIIISCCLLRDKKNDVKYAVIICSLLSFFGFFRGQSVGTDVSIYCKNISHTTFDPVTWSHYTSFENGYNILIAVYNLFFDEPLYFIGLCNIFYIFAFYKYAKSKTTNICLALFFMYMNCFYLNSYNIIRQFFAMSICLLLLSNINLENTTKKENLIIGITVTLTALLFQNTVISLLSIFGYIYFKKWIYNKVTLFNLTIVISVAISGMDFVPNLLSGFSDIFLLNEKTTSYFQAAATGGVEETGFSLLRIIIDSVFLIFISYKVCHIDAYLYMMYLGRLFINLIASINPLFDRVPMILFLLSIPLIEKVWKKDKLSKAVVFLYSCAIFINFMAKNYAVVIPYKFM